LTKYIWEYLGNTIPTELGGGGSAIPVDVPSSLAATPLSSRAIQLAWMDNSTNENGFKIERKNVNGVYSQIASVDANILSYNDVGLAPNATYYYRVRAFNAATDSAYSNEASAVTLTFAGDITIGKAPLVSAGEVRIVGSAKWRGVINPDAGETAKIYFKGSGNGKFEVKIFTLTGELVWEQTMENVSEGMFEWVPKDVASGGYIVYVTGPGLNTNKKIAILR
jgi:hypothetical protein